MDISSEEYLKRIMLPLLFVGLILSAVVGLLLAGIGLPSGPFLAISLTPLIFFTVLGLLYPVVRWERRRKDIDNNIYLFVTHMGVLVLSGMTGRTIFETAKKETGYGEITKMFGIVEEISRKWKITIPEALRIVAKRSPSRILADFMERMAIAMEGNEDQEVFFRNEQEAVMSDYQSLYEASLKKLDIFEEVYMSMITVAIFLVFILNIISLLTTVPQYLVIFISLFTFIILEVLLLVSIYTMVPPEELWLNPWKGREKRGANAPWIFAASISLILGLFLGVFFLNIDNPFIIMAMSVTPLALPALGLRREEVLIRSREENYAPFLRTFGASAEARGVNMLVILRNLRRHDFGPLSEHVVNLYKRLKLNISSKEAWRLFVEESSSSLISKFTDMFVESVSRSKNLKEITILISKNFNMVLSLHRRRKLAVEYLTMLIYGVTFFLVFAMVMVLKIINVMSERLEAIALPEGYVEEVQSIAILKSTSFLATSQQIILLLIVLVHILAAVEIIRRCSGSHPLTRVLHLTGLLWVAGITSYVVSYLLSFILQ